MRFSSILLLLAAMLSIQTGAALAKNLFPLVGATGVTLLRTTFAAVILVCLWRPWTQAWSTRQFRKLALYGFSLGLMNLFFYLSLQYIPLGIAVALEFTGPLLVAVSASRRLVDFAWILLATIGIALILPLTTVSAPLDIRGIAFALGAGFFWALYIVFGKQAGENSHGGKTASLGMVFAALVVFPFGVYDAGPQLLQWQILPLAVLVAILSSALPYSLEMISLKRIPIRTFGILMSLEPVLAVLAGILFLKESLSLNQSFAIGCIVAASLGSSLTSQEEPGIPL